MLGNGTAHTGEGHYEFHLCRRLQRGQNDGLLADISPLSNLRERFEAFGFQVKEIDGHDLGQIIAALEPGGEKPLAILAHTVKGKGVAAIEGNPHAHYAKISEKIALKWKRGLQ